jgi:hypothetical protein
MESNKEVDSTKRKFVGKTDEIFLTQYAFDLKIEELKTATNPTSTEKKITVHVYGNNPEQLVLDANAIYKDARGRFQ